MDKKKFPKVIASTLIEKDGKYLLTKEVLEDNKEYWIVPGGKVGFGESLEMAAKREIAEEVGLEIEITQLVGHHEAILPEFDYHTIIFFFLAKPKNIKISLEEKVLDGQFFSLSDMESLNIVSSAKWLFEKMKTATPKS